MYWGYLGNPGGERGVVDSLADGDVIEEESLGDGVANGELEEDFCMAGELSSSELMEHSGEVSGLQKRLSLNFLTFEFNFSDFWLGIEEPG